MSTEIDGLDSPPVTLPRGQGRADSSLRRLTIRGQPFFVLKQRGSFPAMAYDHGRLLAREIEAGAFPEIIATITRGADDQDSDRMRNIAAALYRAYSDRVLEHVSEEFRQAVDGLADGYRDGMGSPRYARQEVSDAIIAIEVGNLVDGLARVFAIPLVRVLRAVGVVALVLPRLDDAESKTYLKRAEDQPEPQEALAQTLKRLTGPNSRFDFACTGFSVAGAQTRDGRHLHARNLDADLYNWNGAPVLSLIDETPTNAGWHKYAAFGTAGLIYPGGISGLNDAGIAASLHQLSTTACESGFAFGSGDIAPFVQQRILREAATLDEAADIARERRHFAAWTMFCSDAKTGKAMRIEVNGDKVRVHVPSIKAVAQTNHFFDRDMVERHFDEDDGHFTPTFGKWLETHARYTTVTDALSRDVGRGGSPSRVNVDWAIEQLAGSDDAYIEEIRRRQHASLPRMASHRAYGRVARKVYSQLGSIVVADPERRSGRDEVWMTTGDMLPCPHSTYAGWSVDWDALEIAPVATQPLRRPRDYARSLRPAWESALPLYVRARMAVARPRDGAGQLLQRKLAEAETTKGYERAAALLTTAIERAAQDRIVEVPYHYMRARARHAAGDAQSAKDDWDLLLDIWAWQQGRQRIAAAWPVSQPRHQPLLHPYEAALVAVLSTATEDVATGAARWPGRAARLAEATGLLQQLRQQYFADRPAHFDLKTWDALIDALKEKSGQEVELPEPNFVTVE